MIPIIEPVLNPLWVWLLVGEVPSGWALLGGTMVVGAVTARGLTLVWPTPRASLGTPRGMTGASTPGRLWDDTDETGQAPHEGDA